MGVPVAEAGVVRADRPVKKFQFVSGGAGAGLDARSPQLTNHGLAQQGSVALGRSVMIGRRSLVSAALNDAATFSSADLVEQGQTKPLIPLGIDPPDHTRFRTLLEPMFSPRRMEAQEADIADRVN